MQISSPQNSQRVEQDIDFRSIISKYLYHWPVYVLSLVILLGLVFLYLRYTPRVYRSQATVLIKDDNKGFGAGAFKELDLFSGAKVVENEMEILKSKTLVEKVVNDLNLYISYGIEGHVGESDIYDDTPVRLRCINIFPNKIDAPQEFRVKMVNANTMEMSNKAGYKITVKVGEIFVLPYGAFKFDRDRMNTTAKQFNLRISNPVETVDAYWTNLNVSIVNKMATVIELAIKDQNPQRGRDFLNKLIRVYEQAAIQDKNQVAESTLRFVDERLSLLSGELTTVEKDVEDFKSSRGLTDISSEAQLFLQNIKENDVLLNKVNIQLKVIEGLEEYVNDPKQKGNVPSMLGIEDPVLGGLIEKLSALELEYDRLKAGSGANNPLLEPIRQQIMSTKVAVKDNVSGIKSTLILTRNKIESQNARVESSIKQIPKIEREFISIKRQQTIKENLYLYLLQKREESALSYASAISDSRLIDAAYTQPNPVSPKKALAYILGFILGLILPTIYIFIKDTLNNKIIQETDITNHTATPILGDIKYEDNSAAIVVTSQSRNAIAEQFRALRTNLQYIHGKNDGKEGNHVHFQYVG
jgi:tyrosine-protein kinase Etk/Wzc